MSEFSHKPRAGQFLVAFLVFYRILAANSHWPWCGRCHRSRRHASLLVGHGNQQLVSNCRLGHVTLTLQSVPCMRYRQGISTPPDRWKSCAWWMGKGWWCTNNAASLNRTLLNFAIGSMGIDWLHSCSSLLLIEHGALRDACAIHRDGVAVVRVTNRKSVREMYSRSSLMPHAFSIEKNWKNRQGVLLWSRVIFVWQMAIDCLFRWLAKTIAVPFMCFAGWQEHYLNLKLDWSFMLIRAFETIISG